MATNLIAACHIQALAEAQGLCLHHGIPADDLAAALARHGTASALSVMKIPAMLGADYDTHFSLDNMRKDAVYALDLAASQGLGLPAIEAVCRQMEALCSQGLGALDYCVLAKPYQGA